MEKKASHFSVLIHNSGKPRNLGMILRSAAAFNISCVYIIHPSPDKELRFKQIVKHYKMGFGDKGTLRQLTYKIFESFEKFQHFCRINEIELCGINKKGTSLKKMQFNKHSCFVINNLFGGEEILKKCDSLVKVPCYNKDSKGLDVSLETAIVLQKFAEQTGGNVACFTGEKFKALKSRYCFKLIMI